MIFGRTIDLALTDGHGADFAARQDVEDALVSVGVTVTIPSSVKRAVLRAGQRDGAAGPALSQTASGGVIVG